MSLQCTYGSICEFHAAGQIFKYIFQVYRCDVLYAEFVIRDNPSKRLRFTGDLGNGHFDAYLYENQFSAVRTSSSNSSQELIRRRPSTSVFRIELRQH